ncbi:MAG: hypothetical protein WCG16_08475 [Methylococcales bacterium]
MMEPTKPVAMIQVSIKFKTPALFDSNTGFLLRFNTVGSGFRGLGSR